MQTAIFMAEKDSVSRIARLIALPVILVLGRTLGAQVIETPVPFDSAGSVRSVTPALAARLGLGPPAFPASGVYLQARVYRVSTGGHVLVVERADGTLERHALTEEQFAGLRSRMEVAVASIGTRVGEERPDVISEPARGAFLRNQMILAAGLYGPLLASLTQDAKTGTALYLISVGGSYFALNAISKTTPITRAQNDLATDGAIRGASTAVGVLHVLSGDEMHENTYSAVALGGAIAGSALGYVRGRGLTDSEAHSAMKFSTFAAGTTFGLAGALGLLDSTGNAEEPVTAAVLAAGVTGYLLGPAYPRRARHTVTAGDVRLLPIGALLGVLAGATPFVESDAEEAGFAAATAGGLAGLFLADRWWVRPYDHGSGDVTQTWLGTIAGGLLGGAVAVLTEPSPAAAMAMVTGGAVIGAVAGHSLAQPARAGTLRTGSRTGAARTDARFSVQLNPVAVVTGLARAPGTHGVVTVRF